MIRIRIRTGTCDHVQPLARARAVHHSAVTENETTSGSLVQNSENALRRVQYIQ
jgi:hypothetical protein